jgi:hypothetical protein
MLVEEAFGQEAKMCLLCAAGSDGQSFARRTHVLQLLTLVEHPDALPAEAALRLAREVLALTEPDRTGRRCDPVAPPGSALEEAR